MADPLSVASSAVGIISLGIQVCQGLVSYLQCIHGRHKEINSHLREVRSVISIFYSLNEVLPRLAERQGADHAVIQQCLLGCEEELANLQRLVLRLRGPEFQGDLKGKVKEAGRAVLYPFREGEMASIRRCLESLLGHLRLAISVASL